MIVQSSEFKVQSSEAITSTKNQMVKDAVKLMDRRHRDETGLMLIEGRRELQLAVKKGIEFERLFYYEELFREGGERDVLIRAEKLGAELVPVSRHVFKKLAYREESVGLVAVARQPRLALDDIPLVKPRLLVIIEGVEKPGNLGAILRSADAAGADGVIVCGKSTDIYNPNVIRASIGTVFTVPTVEGSSADIINWLRKNKVKIVAATPRTETEYFDADFNGPCAIIMGSEHEGLSDAWLNEADTLVRIPMKGEADSLNLSVSTALLLYEAVRQRK